MDHGTWIERYRDGEREAVWEELQSLGDAIRDPRYLSTAWIVATETMGRVSANVRLVHRALADLHYAFELPDEVVVPPPSDVTVRLDGFERVHGPLPLSLRAFYETVGTVDLRRSFEQMADGNEGLGGQDPLVVLALEDEPEPWDAEVWSLAPDALHKANISGGEAYHVRLPDPRADTEFRPLGVLFLPYLRRTFAGGGFWALGASGPPPELRELVAALLPF